MNIFASWLLKKWGWRCEGTLPDLNHLKVVVISAPHTSMYDYIVGRLFYFANGIDARVMIKKELFFFPLGWILRRIGAFPVNRGKSTGIIDQIVENFSTSSSLVLTITPEGTRKKTKHWKRGFYQIAMQAGVPILPSYFDYRRKVIGIGPMFYPTGNYENDLFVLQKFYVGVTARHPQQFYLPPEVINAVAGNDNISVAAPTNEQ